MNTITVTLTDDQAAALADVVKRRVASGDPVQTPEGVLEHIITQGLAPHVDTIKRAQLDSAQSAILDLLTTADSTTLQKVQQDLEAAASTFNATPTPLTTTGALG